MPNRIAAGNLSHRPLHGWSNECAVLEPGLDSYQYVGFAKLTTTPTSAIDIYLPSGQKSRADRLLVVPANSTIYRIALRLPRALREGESSVYGLLEPGASIVGTAGEKLKVASTADAHTATVPAIACGAGNTYTPGASNVYGATEWGAQTGPLGSQAAATTFRVYVSNAGDTAAGGGISVSKGVAFVIAEVCFKRLTEALDFEQTGYPINRDGG